MSPPTLTPARGGRLDLDGVLWADGFICSHLFDKLMAETPHSVLAVDVYCYKIRCLVDPHPPHLAGRISFHYLNVKNDSRLEGLIKMSDLCMSKFTCERIQLAYSVRPLKAWYGITGKAATNFGKWYVSNVDASLKCQEGYM